jgi:hypothetical protein
VVRNHATLKGSEVMPPPVAVLTVAECLAADAGWGFQPVLTDADSDGASQSTITSVDERNAALEALQLTTLHFEKIRQDTQRVLDTLATQFKTASRF